MRFRVREGQVESPRARGSRADGKGWDRLSLLSPGKLELPAGGLGVGRAGVSLAVQTPFMAETAELSRPGEPCTFLVLSHRISYLYHPCNRGAHLKQ